MKKLSLLFVPALLLSMDLTTLLEHAQKNNDLLKASQQRHAATKKDRSATQKSYYPTLDLSAFYERDDKPTPFYPGTTYGTKATIGVDLYDGGKKTATLQQKRAESHAAKAQYTADIQKLFLTITQEYFNLRTLYASLAAQHDAAKAIKTQLLRIQAFHQAKLATADEVARLQARYHKILYAIDALNLEIFTLTTTLELQTDTPIQKVDAVHFEKLQKLPQTPLPEIASMEYKQKALRNLAKSIESHYYPTLHLEESFTFFGYANRPYFAGQPIPLLDKQNHIMATLGFRLFDFHALSQKKEAVMLQASALRHTIDYKHKEQQVQQSIARKRIETTQHKIQSAFAALQAATLTLRTITQKYEAKLVDQVSYLDALSSHTEAQARYEKARNDLEIAYALYYYYHAKNLKEYLK